MAGVVDAMAVDFGSNSLDSDARTTRSSSESVRVGLSQVVADHSFCCDPW